jgi:hypothetical protein
VFRGLALRQNLVLRSEREKHLNVTRLLPFPLRTAFPARVLHLAHFELTMMTPPDKIALSLRVRFCTRWRDKIDMCRALNSLRRQLKRLGKDQRDGESKHN